MCLATIRSVITGEVVSPAPLDVWREVLAADGGATATSTPEWAAARRAVRPEVADASRLYTLADGRRLLLPLMRRSPVPGVVLESSYRLGDLLADGGVRVSDVALVLEDLLRRRRVARVHISTTYVNTDQWEAGRPEGVVTRPRRVHVLDLDGGFDRVWGERFQPTIRRAIRRAERSDIVVERDTTGRLSATFHDISRQWVEEKARETGVPPSLVQKTVAGRSEPVELFQAVATELGDACRQWVAWRDGVPIAGMISLVHGDHALYWRGYSVKSLAGPVRANNLLQRLAVEDACDSGCRFYGMGGSGDVQTLERFKEGFGASPRPSPVVLVEPRAVAAFWKMGRHARAGARRLVPTSRRVRPAHR